MEELRDTVRLVQGDEDAQLVRIGIRLASSCRGSGDPDAGLDALESCRALLMTGDFDEQTRIDWQREFALLKQVADARAALPLHRELLQRCRERLGDDSVEVVVQHNAIARCCMLLDDFDAAAASAHDARELAQRLGVAVHEVDARRLLARAIVGLGDREGAKEELRTALKLLTRVAADGSARRRELEADLAELEVR